jgi:hypothetical protein
VDFRTEKNARFIELNGQFTIFLKLFNGISVTKVEPGGVDFELSAVASVPLKTPKGAQRS